MTDGQRNSLLMIAVKCGKNKVCEELIRRGSDLDYVNIEGDTALHLAVSLNYKTCLSILLAAGANETIENRLR